MAPFFCCILVKNKEECQGTNIGLVNYKELPRCLGRLVLKRARASGGLVVRQHASHTLDKVYRIGLVSEKEVNTDLLKDGKNGVDVITYFGKKKYAKSSRVVEMGMWTCKNIDCILAVTLTTGLHSVVTQRKNKGESKNKWKYVRKDLSQLILKLRKLGYACEYCFCCEVSPINSLLHLHGFIRFEKPVNCAEFLPLLSKLWGMIHDSPIVDAKELWNMKGAMKYDLKHMLKNYVNSESYLPTMRLLVSKGWLPKGWKEVQKYLVRRALSVRDFDIDEDGFIVGGKYNGEYSGGYIMTKEFVFEKWKVMENELRRWCEGETIEVKYEGKWFLFWRENGENKMLEGEYEEEKLAKTTVA
jgi:hypothetical protein